jgi:uncharacterized protein YoxC
MPLIRTLQAQRNMALDQLADTSAALEHVQAVLRGTQELAAKQQSEIDDLNMRMGKTLAALASMQDCNAKLTEQNLDLQIDLDEARRVPDAEIAVAVESPAGVLTLPVAYPSASDEL